MPSSWAMTHFSRLVQFQSDFADQVYDLILRHPAIRQNKAITLKQLLEANRDELKSASIVIAAINLLTKEGKVRQHKVEGETHPYDNIHIYVVYL